MPVGPPASLALNINNPTSTGPSEAIEQDQQPQQQAKPSGKQANTKQKHMKLSLWDTAGQETYKSITRSYFRGASGALLVFDITRRDTFTSVTSWLNDLRQIAEEGVIVVLVGNKSDLAPASLASGQASDGDGDGNNDINSSKNAENKRQVTIREAEDWCRQNKVMAYVETSAKSGEGVEKAFLEIAERIHQNIEAGKYDLNDRRSGVKGPGAGGANTARTINLAMTDASGPKNQKNCC